MSNGICKLFCAKFEFYFGVATIGIATLVVGFLE
jgi:hypothetical protein